MIREAGPGDAALVERRLSGQLDMAMFPMSNLLSHGLGPWAFRSDDPRASRFWLVGDRAVVGLSRSGILMPVLTEGIDLYALRNALAGERTEGVLGSAPAVRPLLSALGLSGQPTRKDEDEPAFALDLATLRIPDAAGAQLVVADSGWRGLLAEWRAASHQEILGAGPGQAKDLAAADVDRMIAGGTHRLLVLDDKPVALTGFNACLPDIVQVGGVYTPPALRGRGHARLAVALHLSEARARGVRRAVLFAAGPAAARAYRAIGFRPNGRFALVLFISPVTLAA
jgi:GNAT superfamily N-acetyltransferase